MREVSRVKTGKLVGAATGGRAGLMSTRRAGTRGPSVSAGIPGKVASIASNYLEPLGENVRICETLCKFH